MSLLAFPDNPKRKYIDSLNHLTATKNKCAGIHETGGTRMLRGFAQLSACINHQFVFKSPVLPFLLSIMEDIVSFTTEPSIVTLKSMGVALSLHRHPEMAGCFSQPGRQGQCQCQTPRFCVSGTEEAVFPESRVLPCISSVFLSGFKQFLPPPKKESICEVHKEGNPTHPLQQGYFGEK